MARLFTPSILKYPQAKRLLTPSAPIKGDKLDAIIIDRAVICVGDKNKSV